MHITVAYDMYAYTRYTVLGNSLRQEHDDVFKVFDKMMRARSPARSHRLPCGQISLHEIERVFA